MNVRCSEPAYMTSTMTSPLGRAHIARVGVAPLWRMESRVTPSPPVTRLALGGRVRLGPSVVVWDYLLAMGLLVRRSLHRATMGASGCGLALCTPCPWLSSVKNLYFAFTPTRYVSVLLPDREVSAVGVGPPGLSAGQDVTLDQGLQSPRIGMDTARKTAFFTAPAGGRC